MIYGSTITCACNNCNFFVYQFTPILLSIALRPTMFWQISQNMSSIFLYILWSIIFSPYNTTPQCIGTTIAIFDQCALLQDHRFPVIILLVLLKKINKPGVSSLIFLGIVHRWKLSQQIYLAILSISLTLFFSSFVCGVNSNLLR